MRIFLIGAVLSTLAMPALADGGGESQCGPMDQMRAGLASQFHELEVRQGVSQRGWLMHLFMAPDGATWTIVGEKPGTGAGCVLDAGTDLQEPPLPEPDQGQGL